MATAMSEELEVLKIVAERLRGAGIAYMLTGSVAMNHYAVLREPGASPERIPQAIFLRFYGRDFDEATRDRIAVSLARPVRSNRGPV